MGILFEEDVGNGTKDLQKPHGGIERIEGPGFCLAVTGIQGNGWPFYPVTGGERTNRRNAIVSRVLSNPWIQPLSVMKGFIPEVILMMGEQGQTVIVMMDQSKISDGFECQVVSLPVADRAHACGLESFKNQECQAMGYDVQQVRLNKVFEIIPLLYGWAMGFRGQDFDHHAKQKFHGK